MKDPCEICIVQVTCTSICYEKQNFEALVKTAVKQNTIHRKTGIPRGINFIKYAVMQSKNNSKATEITERRYRKRGEDDDTI